MEIEVKTLDKFKSVVEQLNLSVVQVNDLGLATNGALTLKLKLPTQEAIDLFLSTFPTVNQELVQKTIVEPFATKGDNHFRGTGVEGLAQTNGLADIDLEVVYPVARYNGIEILNGDYGDEVTLSILDDANGTYSGTPGATLDTFGINWKMKKELIQILPYEATLYKGMVICVKYKNNTASDKTIYVNHYLHEVT